MGSGKWEVGSGKWEVRSEKWEVGSGKWGQPLRLPNIVGVNTLSPALDGRGKGRVKNVGNAYMRSGKKRKGKMSLLEKEVKLVGSKGEKITKALFDSGSTYSCIKKEVAEQVGTVELLGEPLKASIANGEVLNVTERVGLEFRINGYRLFDEFMVISELSEDVIIGAYTFQKYKIKLDFENDEVIVDPRILKIRI